MKEETMKIRDLLAFPFVVLGIVILYIAVAIIKKRIAELREKLDDKYLPENIREEIEKDLELLLAIQHALYFY